MTIYKTPSGEKKQEKDGDVLKEPLTGVEDEMECEEGAVPKLVRVTYFPRRRRTWVNLCLVLTALLVLGTGTIAAIFLYRHLSTNVSEVYRGRCGVTFRDEIYAQQQAQAGAQVGGEWRYGQPVAEFVEEDIEVSDVELYERFNVPRFDEVEETVVWHDFDKNLTAIVDPTHHACYIMPLNRTRIAPPHDLIDLIMKLKTRYYMPKASVVREEYRVVLPPLQDLSVLGNYIMQECFYYYTFRLEPYVSGVYKRSTDQQGLRVGGHYGFIAYSHDTFQLLKLTVLTDQDKLQDPVPAIPAQ